jgi:hypothetical protein
MCFYVSGNVLNEPRLNQSPNQNLQASRELFATVLAVIAALNDAVSTQALIRFTLATRWTGC